MIVHNTVMYFSFFSKDKRVTGTKSCKPPGNYPAKIFPNDSFVNGPFSKFIVILYLQPPVVPLPLLMVM